MALKLYCRMVWEREDEEADALRFKLLWAVELWLAAGVGHA
jgi:hypothetical protein